jgi:Tfp pilus assembly protein PilF
VGFAALGFFRFGNPFWGGWSPVFTYGAGFGYRSALGFGFAPPVVVAVPVPVPVVGAGGLEQTGDPRSDTALPQQIRPDAFVIIAPRKDVTVPEVNKIAVPPRPVKPPVIAFDPFKPAAAVKAEMPEADPKKEAARLVNLARAAFAAGEYGRAAEHLERALRADPADAVAYFLHAQAKFAAGKYAEAVASIREGLARDPRWPTAPFDPTTLYGDRPERFVVHLVALRKAVAANPNEATLEFLLGYQLWFSGERAEADKLFRAAEKRLAAPGPIALFK